MRAQMFRPPPISNINGASQDNAWLLIKNTNIHNNKIIVMLIKGSLSPKCAHPILVVPHLQKAKCKYTNCSENESESCAGGSEWPSCLCIIVLYWCTRTDPTKTHSEGITVRGPQTGGRRAGYSPGATYWGPLVYSIHTSHLKGTPFNPIWNQGYVHAEYPFAMKSHKIHTPNGLFVMILSYRDILV